MLFLLTNFPQKLKLKKVYGALIILFYVSSSCPPLQSRFKEIPMILSKNSHLRKYFNFVTEFHILLETQEKQPLFSKSLVRYTKSSFKENARNFSKNSTKKI